MFDFDKSRRTLIFNLRAFPQRIGAYLLPSKNKETFPELAPFSKLVDPDGNEYYETNHGEVKFNSANEPTGVIFSRPPYGEIEDVQYTDSTKVLDKACVAGLTRPVPDEIVLHEFSRF